MKVAGCPKIGLTLAELTPSVTRMMMPSGSKPQTLPFTAPCGQRSSRISHTCPSVFVGIFASCGYRSPDNASIKALVRFGLGYDCTHGESIFRLQPSTNSDVCEMRLFMLSKHLEEKKRQAFFLAHFICDVECLILSL